MPFMICKTNKTISDIQEQELKSRLGKAIEVVAGLSEQVLMIGIEDNYHFYLRGSKSEPVALIEISIFANPRHYGYDELTKEVTNIFNEVLNIDKNSIYIKYDDIVDWGVGGRNFDLYAR
ncbi:MAG: hypothetical protein IJ529_03425 [Alphaproteobacteria bacterium]|nr:hypothetical protein [Alphaproteobacteria bacterium]